MQLISQIEEFFTYQTYTLTSIASLILEEKSKVKSKRNHTIIKELENEAKKGEYKKSLKIQKAVKHTDDFNEYYNEKLSVFKSDFNFLNDFDFIDWHSKKSQKFLIELEQMTDALNSKNLSIEEYRKEVKLVDLYIFLVNKWLIYIQDIKQNLQITNTEFFQKWRSKKGWYDENNIMSINTTIRVYIVDRFKYFNITYKGNWDSSLINIFNSITEFNLRIDGYQLENGTLLRIDLEAEKNHIEKTLLGFERFFELMLSYENPRDCLKLMNIIREIIVTYSLILRNWNLYFEQSYFYETIIKFYHKIEQNYNAEKLKLLSFTNENKTNEISESVNSLFLENNFNHRSVSEVRNHFSSRLKKYASNSTIEQFLHSAFQIEKIPTELFKFSNPLKGKIMAVFADFYNESGKKKGDSERYANLLCNYFEGFPEAIKVTKTWTKESKNRK